MCGGEEPGPPGSVATKHTGPEGLDVVRACGGRPLCQPRLTVRVLHPRPRVTDCQGAGASTWVDREGHGRAFPNRRANAGPDQIATDSRSSSGRCVLSRHLAEGHSQVLIIAPIAV